MTGYARVHRALLDHPAFRNDAEAMAFAWLVLRAGWKAGRVRYKNRVIALRRGQLALSIRDFAAAMDRPKGWVERLFVRLRDETMIETTAGQGVLIITICNYDRYQADIGDGETPPGTAYGTGAGQAPDTDKGKEESKNRNRPPKAAGGSKLCLPEDWTPPPVADLPPAARGCAAQWSAASYAAQGEAFAGYWRGRRGRNADWRATWANRVVTIHGMVMRDEKFGRAPPDAASAAPARPAMSAAERAAYLDRLATRPWAGAAPRTIGAPA